MTTMTERLETSEQTAPEFEGEIREVLRRDVSFWRRRDAAGGDSQGDNPIETMNGTISRISGSSILEIERVITELQGVRDMLRSEGDRVQREIGNYARLGQAAMQSMKVIADSLTQWKPAARRIPDALDAPRVPPQETADAEQS